MAALRRRTRELLEHTRREDFAACTIDVGLILLISANGVAVVLESVPSVGRDYGTFLRSLRAVLDPGVHVEYMARVWSIVELDSPKYKHPLWGRLRYAGSPLRSSICLRSCRSI